MTEQDIKPGQFYYHFKRNPDMGVEHGAYYCLGLGMNTEDRSEHYVVLKPLYYCDPRKEDEGGISYQVRPIDYFITPIDREYYAGPRFQYISDPAVINQLRETELFSSQYLDQ